MGEESDLRLEILKRIFKKGRSSSLDLGNILSRKQSDIKKELEYLKGKGLVVWKFKTADGNLHAIKLTSDGIDKVEKFLRTIPESIDITKKPDGILPKFNSIIERLDKIEGKVEEITNRKNREINYKTTIISLLIATFIGISFSSLVEFLSGAIDPQYSNYLQMFYYFVTLTSVIVLVLLFDKIQSILKLKEYDFMSNFDTNDSSMREFCEEVRKIVAAFVKMQKMRVKFKGKLWYGLEFHFKTRGESLEEKENTAFEEFGNKIRKITYEFYNDEKKLSDLTQLVVDFKNGSVSVWHAKKFEYDKAIAIRDTLKLVGNRKYSFRMNLEDGY